MSCHLTSLPFEIFNKIVYELTCLEPLGPPSIVIPLMQTCRRIHHLLSPDNNTSLYGEIYRFKFDTGAVSRRAFVPTPTQCTAQLRRTIAAMRVFRSQDVCHRLRPDGPAHEFDLFEALQIAFVMLLDDDGRNSVQLLLWAQADVFVKNLIRLRLYEGSQHNDGWPVGETVIAHALWIMWLLTSEESLLREAPEERAEIQRLLIPFVYLPVRYTSFYAPPNNFLLPLSKTDNSMEATTILAAHGPYPVYHSEHEVDLSYFEARCTFACPPAAAAAKLCFMARGDVTPMPIAPHFHRTRADRHAAGVYTVGPTREDIEEFNWGWGVHLPLGSGLRYRSGIRKMVEGWGGREWDGEYNEDEPYPTRPSIQSTSPVPPPLPRWVGKAPHAMATGEGISKSRQWDMDWMRVRFCGNIWRPSPRIPYGTMYEFGVLDGLWQGSLLVPGFERLQPILENPEHPPHGMMTEESLGSTRIPMFVRFRELHGVEGEVVSSIINRAFSTDNLDFDDASYNVPFAFNPESQGMMNGWFDGQTAPRLTREKDGKVTVQVGNERSTYRCWPQGGSQRLGNDAYSSTELSMGEEQGCRRIRDDAEKVRYRHDASTCSNCPLYELFQSKVDIWYDENVPDEEFEDEEGLFTAWDNYDSVFHPIDEHGKSIPPTPKAHDWKRRGQGQCSGVGEVIVIGETDPAHAAAFEDYRFYGRIRLWDGMIILLRDSADTGLGSTVFAGNIVGQDTIVGTWRWGGTDPSIPGHEGTFTLARRLD
ncbi:hypothetical protein H0H92_005095 [Tricholoma furcatifolium]|nr:hypothetical protein H0H92_005095 [Tricholoma furcatifolium]